MLKDIPKLENYKVFWEHQMEQLYSYHKKSENGKVFLHMHAEAMDALLQFLYNKATSLYEKIYQKKWSYPISLIGLSGYGRNELFPHSTLDLMLLHSEKIQSEVLDRFIDIFNENILHPLWNLQIKVNKKFSTINNAIDQAKKVFQIKNALLDARFICGSHTLFNLFQEAYEIYFFQTESIDHFIHQILEEKTGRHKKYHNTLFFLEPDIKFGLGGLRDYQTILWISRAKFKSLRIQDIESKGLLYENQIEQLSQAHNFLIRVRSELHFQSQSSANLLNRELQPSIAWNLGYTIADRSNCVKIFMKDYYKYTQCIHNLVEIFEQKLLQTIHDAPNNIKREKKEFDGFILCNNNLSYNSIDIFKTDPLRLLRAFKYSQQYKSNLSLELKILIKNSINLITNEIIHDIGFNKCLCSLFQSIGDVAPIFQLMHELEVLDVFIPEFQDIKHLVYNDYSHDYTVDVHTIYSLAVIDEIFQNSDPSKNHYYNAIKDTSTPWLVYLISILYGLGKTNSEDSPKLSALLAKKILDRFSIGPKEKEHIILAIENHSLMKSIWQKYDIYDTRKIEEFSFLIQCNEILNYLYISTYCDIKTAAQYFWTAHKESLHTQFFKNVKSLLINNEEYHKTLVHQKKEFCRELFNKQWPKVSNAEVEQIINLYPDNYFLFNELREIELHFHLLKQFNTNTEFLTKYNESIFPIIHWEGDLNHYLTTVTVITQHDINLLTKLVGTFHISGFKILHEKTFTRSDNIGIHIFYIIDAKNNYHTLEYSKRVFLKNLNETLNDNKLLSKPILGLTIKPSLYDIQKIQKAPTYSPKIDVYHKELLKQIILEIRCHDQIRLLSKITSIIADFKFDILFAKISTEYQTVTTTFHLSKNDNTQSSSHELLILRERLNETLTVEDSKQS